MVNPDTNKQKGASPRARICIAATAVEIKFNAIKQLKMARFEAQWIILHFGAKGQAARKVLTSMDKKTFQPGDFYSILAGNMHKGLGAEHHGIDASNRGPLCTVLV